VTKTVDSKEKYSKIGVPANLFNEAVANISAKNRSINGKCRQNTQNMTKAL